MHRYFFIPAATHRPLGSMLESGQFRTDLFHRLSVFPIIIPPLRDRREDIPALAEAILLRLSKRLNRRSPVVTPRALAALTKYDWPGNVRELSNALERGLILTRGDELDLGALAFGFSDSLRSSRTFTVETKDQTLEGSMRQIMERSLRASRGKIYGADGAAARLGVKPSTLQSKMKKLGVERKAFVR